MQGCNKVNKSLECIGDAYFCLDCNWKFTYANKSAEKILGKNTEELVGKVIWHEFPELVGTDIEKACGKAMKIGILQCLETKGRLPGTWYNVIAYPCCTGISVYCYDISKLKKYEDEIIFQSHLLESVHDAIVAADENYRISYWNHMAERIFGWTAQEATGHSSEEIFKTIFPNSTRKYIMDIIYNDGLYIGEVICHHKDGRPLCTGVRSKALRDADGKFKGYVATLRDITELKQMETELKTSRDKYQALIETNADFIWEVDRAGRFTYCSPQVEKLWGYKPADLIGKSAFDTMPFNEREEWFKDFKKVPEFSGEVWRVQTISRDKNGNTVSVETSGVPFFDDKGEFAGYRGITRDITENKKSEQALQGLVKKLRKLDEHKNSFLASLSHELRNPMASIMMGISLIEHGEKEGKTSLNTVKIMKRQITQLSRLIDDLLDVTRIKNNKIKLKKETIELNDAVYNVTMDYNYQFAEKGVKLEVELAPVELYLEADITRITQAIANLLGNALKFTENGGNVKVRLALDEENREAIISIRDTGLGIPPELIPDLFEPFIQADKTLDRSGGGLGLGLAIVKGIIELHHGSISVLSEGLGKGSEFIARLPISYEKNQLL